MAPAAGNAEGGVEVCCGHVYGRGRRKRRVGRGDGDKDAAWRSSEQGGVPLGRLPGAMKCLGVFGVSW